jgi:hypothetical protein
MNDIVYDIPKIKANETHTIYAMNCDFSDEYIYFHKGCHFVGSLNEDDINYNHCYDLYKDFITQTAENEYTYSVYAFLPNQEIMFANAITAYLKWKPNIRL